MQRRLLIPTYLGVKAVWRFATDKRLAPPGFSHDAMCDQLRMLMGRQHYVDSLPLTVR